MTYHNEEILLEYPPVDFTDTTITWCNFTEDYVACVEGSTEGVLSFSEETLMKMLCLVREVKLEESVDE